MTLVELEKKFRRAQINNDFDEMVVVAAWAIRDLSANDKNKGHRSIDVDPKGPYYEIEHFGVCPKCLKSDGFMNVGRNHFFVCHQHKLCWYVGSNLFSNWRDEPEELHEENNKKLSSYECLENSAMVFYGHEGIPTEDVEEEIRRTTNA